MRYAAMLAVVMSMCVAFDSASEGIYDQVAPDHIHTGQELDLVIMGTGYFKVELPDGATAYTRDGHFETDREGNLVTKDGYDLDPRITLPSNRTATAVRHDGAVDLFNADSPNAQAVGIIRLARFPNPSGLASHPIRGLYIETHESGPPLDGYPGEDGLGELKQGYLERTFVPLPADIPEPVVDRLAAQSVDAFASDEFQEEEEMLRISLNDEAFVRGPRVLLGEVATIEGAGAEKLADLEITTSPRPGSTNSIQAALVETRIRNSAIAPSDYKISGSKLIRATRLHQEIMGFEIGEDLRSYVLANLPWEPTNANVEVTPPNFDVTVPDGEVTIKWEANPNYKYLGATSFSGSIYVDGVLERTVMGRVNIEAFGDVVVADRDIPRGSIIRPDDLVIEKMSLENKVRGSYTEMDEVVGKVAKTTIFPGNVVTNRKIDTPILVRRHQTVNVISRVGSLVARTQARSRDDGRAGDLITLIDPSTKDTIQGVIQADGSVEIM